MNGWTTEQLFEAEQNAPELLLASRYAPRILLDRNEPFIPSAVGYSIFHTDGYSSSFPRCIGLRPVGRAPGAMAIEYAIWWDWDIGHLYELEHIWVFVAAGGEVVHCEGSWHGDFQTLRGVEGACTLHGETHPVAWSQPGKHAFSGSPQVFRIMGDYARKACTEHAGEGGLLVTSIFQESLGAYKQTESDARIRAYLRHRAFEPAFEWDVTFEVCEDQLVPWAALRDWIPDRIAHILHDLPGIAEESEDHA